MWFLGATVAPAAYRPLVQIAMRRARYLSQNCHKTLSPSISVGHYLFAAWYRCSVPMEMQLTITSIHFMMSMLQGQVQIRLDRETCNEFYEVCEHHTSSPVFAFCAQVFWAALPSVSNLQPTNPSSFQSHQPYQHLRPLYSWHISSWFFSTKRVACKEIAAIQYN